MKGQYTNSKKCVLTLRHSSASPQMYPLGNLMKVSFITPQGCNPKSMESPILLLSQNSSSCPRVSCEWNHTLSICIWLLSFSSPSPSAELEFKASHVLGNCSTPGLYSQPSPGFLRFQQCYFSSLFFLWPSDIPLYGHTKHFKFWLDSGDIAKVTYF